MKVEELLEAAKEVAQRAAMHWYASDASDGAEPRGRCPIVITDAGWAARVIEAGHAKPVAQGAQLDRAWEWGDSAISFSRVWSDAFVAHLQQHGVSATKLDQVSRRKDTTSLERGLSALSDSGMACISVETFEAGGHLWVSRPQNGPFVLQLIRGLTELPTAAAYLADAHERGLDVRQADGNAMIGLGTNKTVAVAEILNALRALFEVEPTTVVARYAPVTLAAW